MYINFSACLYSSNRFASPPPASRHSTATADPPTFQMSPFNSHGEQESLLYARPSCARDPRELSSVHCAALSEVLRSLALQNPDMLMFTDSFLDQSGLSLPSLSLRLVTALNTEPRLNYRALMNSVYYYDIHLELTVPQTNQVVKVPQRQKNARQSTMSSREWEYVDSAQTDPASPKRSDPTISANDLGLYGRAVRVAERANPSAFPFSTAVQQQQQAPSERLEDRLRLSACEPSAESVHNLLTRTESTESTEPTEPTEERQALLPAGESTTPASDPSASSTSLESSARVPEVSASSLSVYNQFAGFLSLQGPHSPSLSASDHAKVGRWPSLQLPFTTCPSSLQLYYQYLQENSHSRPVEPSF